MQPTNINISELFGNKVQYKIPLFQRHYVWDEDGQWQPLWEDIAEKINQRLSEQQRDKFNHFTGAIVIQQKQTNVDEVKKYEIIDGQQRLTTFQIILCALKSICQSLKHDELSNEINGYILNNGMLSPNYENERYKLIPTEFDKPALESIIDQSSNISDYKKSKIAQAFNYFTKKFKSIVERIEKSFYHFFIVY